MNVTEKFRLTIAEGEPLDWAMLSTELDAEHAAAQTARQRGDLLALFFVMADMVERIDTTADTLADFRDDRHRSYHNLLLREACPDGRFCVTSLNQVTEREVDMGRMLQDDPMRISAVNGFAGIKQAMHSAPDRQSAESLRLAGAAVSAGGALQRWRAHMAGLTRRSAALWRRTPQHPTA